jgi:hypothetical protein
MYAAKGQGKHRWQRYDSDIHGPITDVAPSILADLPDGVFDASRPD